MATANGIDIIDATITMPRIGAWTADVTVDGLVTDKLTGAVALQEGGASFSGTSVRPPRSWAGKTSVRVVGGRGGLPKALAAKFYFDAPLVLPLGEIVAAAGEVLAGTSDASITSKHLAKWVRAAGPAVHALTELVENAGAVWRILADGTLWVGVETWPVLEPAGEVMDDAGADGRVLFAPERLELRPGVTWQSRRVSHVTHRITPKLIRTEVLFEGDGETRARGRGALDALIDRRLARTRFHGIYAGKVVKHEASKVEIVPDDSRLPGLTNVPVRLGLPGSSLDDGAAVGRRALVTFENGDPKAPVVIAWEDGGSAKIGSLLLSQNTSTAAIVRFEFYPAGTTGDAAAEAQRLADLASGHLAMLVPVTAAILDVS